jgi:putative protein kinase ArgK-like GTPase of G3E family
MKHAKHQFLESQELEGSGKSSLVDELVRRFLVDFPEKNISVDPSKRKQEERF